MYKFVSFAFGTGKLFEDRHKKDAHQSCGKAAVIKAHSAVKLWNGGDDAVVEHSSRHAVDPTVSVGNGAQAVCIAQTDDNGLVIQKLSELAA